MREETQERWVINLSFRVMLAFIFVVIISAHFTCRAYDNEASNNQGKVVYLTFDDGPSFIVTNAILDILKEKGVNATFFVVGNKIKDREEILKRIQSDGHSIGLHSYSHVYKKIYANDENFIREMDMTAEEVNRVLGYKPTAIRFPTGSKPHLDSDLLQKLHEKNYRIFDWNATLSDGLNNNTPPKRLVKQAAKIVGKSPSRVILLLHCDQTNKNTAKALPYIIDHYKELGYEFKAIDENTPEFYFRFKKK